MTERDKAWLKLLGFSIIVSFLLRIALPEPYITPMCLIVGFMYGMFNTSPWNL